ncbi:EamA family transporter [Candidatus Bipolaricaulota bacterium]|nr:EamA family transporter [Candidatus Bipolaricaulota bacterium]
MHLSAILLVLASGFLHAGWNYLAKSSRDKISFLWLAKLAALLVLSPLLLYYLFYHGGLEVLITNYRTLLYLGVGSGFVHFFYNYFLSMAYRFGDISFTYPIARGLAPFLVALFSFFFLSEVPSSLGILGMALVASGMFLMVASKSAGEENEDDGPDKDKGSSLLSGKAPLIFAVLTSVTIASYIFLDGKGSREFTPFLFMYAYSLTSTILLAVPVMKRKEELVLEFETNLKNVLFTGVMMPSSYFLALSAMQLAQLGYVASFRNISVVFATLLGVVKLKEEFTFYRLIGSLVIFLGAVLLSIG